MLRSLSINKKAIQFVNYLDDHNAMANRGNELGIIKFRVRPYKYSMGEEDD